MTLSRYKNMLLLFANAFSSSSSQKYIRTLLFYLTLSFFFYDITRCLREVFSMDLCMDLGFFFSIVMLVYGFLKRIFRGYVVYLYRLCFYSQLPTGSGSHSKLYSKICVHWTNQNTAVSATNYCFIVSLSYSSGFCIYIL